MEISLIYKILLVICTLATAYFIYKQRTRSKHNKNNNDVVFDKNLLHKIKKIMINNDLSVTMAEDIMNQLHQYYSKNYRESHTVQKISMQDVKMHINTILLNKIKNPQLTSSLNRIGVKIPEVFVLLGNNGVGKTNFAVKLAYYLMHSKVDLREGKKRKILITSLDFFRAGAWKQLQFLVENNPMDGVEYFEPKAQNVKGHTYETYAYGEKNHYDAIIFDTSGRIHTNDSLMDEIKEIQKILKTANANLTNILVLDNNFGSMAINSLEAFTAVTPVDGIVITKTDSGFGGGWLFKLIEQTKTTKLFGQVSGEQLNSFSEFNREQFCKNLINWDRVD